LVLTYIEVVKKFPKNNELLLAFVATFVADHVADIEMI